MLAFQRSFWQCCEGLGAKGVVTEGGFRRYHVASGEESTCQCRRLRFYPWVGKMPWKRKWHLTAVFLPGKCHGQRGLVGYSPWGHKELDTTEQLSTIQHEVQEGSQREGERKHLFACRPHHSTRMLDVCCASAGPGTGGAAVRQE